MLIKWNSTRRGPIGQLVGWVSIGLSELKLVKCGEFRYLVVRVLGDSGVASEL